MPTVLRTGPYRLYFFSHEPNEPPHVHLDRDDSHASFGLSLWRLLIILALTLGDFVIIEAIVIENTENLLEAWYEFFGR